MMGPKKLKEIRRELRQHLGKGHKDLSAWLDRHIVTLRPESDSKVAEDLLWVRKMLRAATKRTTSGKSTKPKGRKSPAV